MADLATGGRRDEPDLAQPDLAQPDLAGPNLAGPDLAEIGLAEQHGVRVVTVAGELDISNVGALEDVTFDLPNADLGVVVDLSAATYIDSAALGLLFKLRGALQRRGQALRVACPPASVARRVLAMTGFDPQSTDDERAGAIGKVRAAAALTRSAQEQSAAAQELLGRRRA